MTTIRAAGLTSVSITIETRERLRQLAGSKHIYVFLDELTKRLLDGSQTKMPIRAETDMAAVEREVKETRELMSELVKYVRHYVTHPVVETVKRSPSENIKRAWDFHLSPKLQSLVDKADAQDSDNEVNRD